MKKRSISKYRIGLIIAIILSLGLFAAVLYQAGIKKQDERTQKIADDISSKLSNYVYDKQLVPESLASADIRKVPSAITYKKVDRTSYRFCVAYRSSYFGPYHKGGNCWVENAYLQPFIKNADGSYTV